MNTIVKKLKIDNADKVLEKRAKVKYFHVFIEEYGSYLFEGTISQLEDSMKANGARPGLRSEKHEIPWRLYDEYHKNQEDLISWKVAIIKFLGEGKIEEFIEFKNKRDIKIKNKSFDVVLNNALREFHESE